MAYKARWGNKGFLVSPTKIVPFDSLSTSISIKTDSGNDTSGTNTTNTRGRELQTITFSTKYMRATGTDPRRQLEEWEAELGKIYPLYIGNKRFGPAKLMLTKVDVAELILSNNGDFLSLTLNITLQEYSETATSTTTSATSATDSVVAAAYKTAAEKTAAMNATATASDKADKKA